MAGGRGILDANGRLLIRSDGTVDVCEDCCNVYSRWRKCGSLTGEIYTRDSDSAPNPFKRISDGLCWSRVSTGQALPGGATLLEPADWTTDAGCCACSNCDTPRPASLTASFSNIDYGDCIRYGNLNQCDAIIDIIQGSVTGSFEVPYSGSSGFWDAGNGSCYYENMDVGVVDRQRTWQIDGGEASCTGTFIGQRTRLHGIKIWLACFDGEYRVTRVEFGGFTVLSDTLGLCVPCGEPFIWWYNLSGCPFSPNASCTFASGEVITPNFYNPPGFCGMGNGQAIISW